MGKWYGKILIPATLVGIAAVQSFGIDAGRALRILPSRDTTEFLLQADTSARQSNKQGAANTAVTLTDSFSISIDSTMASADSLNADSIILTARDTIIAPDSLREADPVRYRYFVELKDSLTRAITRDSLLAAGDTLEVTRLDSLYIKDSTDIADAAELARYNAMSRREKKKYRYEKELPLKMARMDSILNRKDSLKARRDSITEATPRILETYAIPDSLQYKRILMWDHDRDFNNIRLQTLDTSYNYHFNDNPIFKKDVNASYLGTTGSAAQLYNYFKRDNEENVVFYTPYQHYSYTPENLPFYNTKTPYTELAYWGTLFSNKEKEESNIKILTTQNILPELNVTLEYHRFGSNGMLNNEKTDNRTFIASTNYMGKKYLMHAAYIYNKVQRNENGGVVDNFWIRDTTVDAREIAVNLTSASNKIKRNTVFLDQSYRVQLNFLKQEGTRQERREAKKVKDSILASGDSLAIAELLEKEGLRRQSRKDSVDRNVTSAFIGHSSEYSVFTKRYEDNITDENGRNFYNNRFYLNPTSSADSMRVMRLENKVYIRLQPWKADGIVSKLDVGIGDKLLNYYRFTPSSYLVKNRNAIENSLFLYAGAQGQYRKYLDWDAKGRYTFLGHEINDFGIEANLTFKAYPFRKERNSPLALSAHFETTLKEPDYYQQHFYSNHYRWDNSFGKISSTKVQATLAIPRWKLEASFGYALLSNNIYFDTEGIARQNSTPMSVMTASLMKNFKLWKFHFDHRLLFQLSSNDEVMPLPMLAMNFRYYFQFNVVRNVMQMQLGADARFTTKWYAPTYNPVLGVFHNQKDFKYGNCPDIDVFVNVQWKRACIFIKVINIGMGWPNDKADYFSAHHYIHSQTAFKIGIFWPFYVQAGKNARVGGGGGSGAGTGRSNAIGN
ncbi:MAG: putative porin [Bacteroidales bacterium]|nr:putative porin [Bacteroidales bacterium]